MSICELAAFFTGIGEAARHSEWWHPVTYWLGWLFNHGCPTLVAAWYDTLGADPFTDVFSAYLRDVISLADVRLWLVEWVEYGAPASALCRVAEYGTRGCDVAIDNAYRLAYLFGLLVH
jgi:hypothetical protein